MSAEQSGAVFWKGMSLSGLALCVALALWAWRSGHFDSVEALQAYVGQFGRAGMAFFILLQCIQVVVPILPGGVSCLAGVLLYGPWLGFVCNYVGICLGSLAAFGIARCLGRAAFAQMFSEKQLQKYTAWTEKDGLFFKLFAAAIVFPVAPDDLLCYLAGTTAMSWQCFTAVILLGKPVSIALYSLGLMEIFQLVFPGA